VEELKQKNWFKFCIFCSIAAMHNRSSTTMMKQSPMPNLVEF
jgi:hypothetical protein